MQQDSRPPPFVNLQDRNRAPGVYPNRGIIADADFQRAVEASLVDQNSQKTSSSLHRGIADADFQRAIEASLVDQNSQKTSSSLHRGGIADKKKRQEASLKRAKQAEEIAMQEAIVESSHYQRIKNDKEIARKMQIDADAEYAEWLSQQ